MATVSTVSLYRESLSHPDALQPNLLDAIESLSKAIHTTTDDDTTVALLALRSLLNGKVKRFDECWEDGTRLAQMRPKLATGYLRMAACMFHQGRYEDALALFEQALAAPCLQEKDLKAISTGLELCCRRLGLPLPPPAGHNPRTRYVIPCPNHTADIIQMVKLPRNFSWLVPGVLCGLSIPKRPQQLNGLAHLNVRLIVTLFETPLAPAIVDGTTVKPLWLYVENYRPPTVEQVDNALQEMETVIKGGGAVAVHCGGGKGRAGTLLACYVLKHGLSPPSQGQYGGSYGCVYSGTEVIDLLRTLRPGSIETVEQERFIKHYADVLWGRQTVDCYPDKMDKYPSTPHLPFSPEIHSDEIKLQDSELTQFLNQEVVITEKLDGGNCCLHGGKVYARTHSQEASHASFGPIKSMLTSFAHELGDDTYLFGENMVGIHSITYDNLSSFFYLFAVYQSDIGWLSWDQVVVTADRLGVPVVPVVFRGVLTSGKAIQSLMESKAKLPSAVGRTVTPEGFVIRLCRSFAMEEFERSIAKFVRKGHVQTDETWLRTWQKATLRVASTSDSPPATVVTTKPSKPVPARTVATVALKSIKMILLVGLPGSGKSSFARQLLSSNPRIWEYICQDELGSRRLCEQTVARTLLGRNTGKRVILDRCNVTVEDRKNWLDIAMITGKQAVVIHFDICADVCKERVVSRMNHPTIPFGHGSKIVDSFVKQLEPPTDKEKFAQIFRVTTFEEANSLLNRFGASSVAMEPSPSFPGEAEPSYESISEHTPSSDIAPLSLEAFGSLSLARIESMFELRSQDVVSVFVCGSRLWGTARSDSDLDLMIITKIHERKTTKHKMNIDVCLMGEDEYMNQLENHHLSELVTLFVPNQFCLKNGDVPNRFKLNKRRLLESVQAESARDWSVAEKFIRKGEIVRGKKVLGHMFRNYVLAGQLARHASIVDLAACNHLHNQLMDCSDNQWDYFSTVFWPIKEEHDKLLVELCTGPLL